MFEVHVVGVEYPGYGVCSGAADAARVIGDAECVFRFLEEQLAVPALLALPPPRSLSLLPAG